MTLALTKEDKTPRKTPHEAAAETLLARLQRALDHAASAPDSRFAREHLAQGYDPRADPATLGAMASDLAARIDAVSAFYKVDRRIKTAVNERLAAHWWLTDRSPMSDTLPRGEDPAARWERDGFAVTSSAEEDAIQKGKAPTLLGWPMNVSLAELVSVYERSRDEHAQRVITKVREWAQSMSAPPAVSDLEHSFARMTFQSDDATLRFRTAALVVWAEKKIREDQERARAFAMPSTLQARAATYALTRGGKRSAWPMDAEGRVRLRLEPTEQPGEVRAILRVAWGRRFVVPSEFSLSFLGTPTATVIRAVLNELKDDGLRDWLTLHRMAARQGRVGHFVWTWAEHKQATAYEARIRHSSVSEDEARNAVMRRLWSLHGADLWVEGQNESGEVVRQRVGEQGLISIDATRHRGDNIEAAMIRINPSLYTSARHDVEEKHFTPIPEAVLRLNGPALRLGAMLAFEFRWARDAGASMQIEESELFLLAGILGDGKPSPDDLTHARRTLKNALAEALSALGEGAAFSLTEESTSRHYTILPPQWLKDALVHGVPPELPETCPSSLPRTGEQLIEWRKKKNWTQERVAKQLEVGISTIKRAELRPKETLPKTMLQKLERLLAKDPDVLPEPIEVKLPFLEHDPNE
jgi:hypothetical protein